MHPQVSLLSEHHENVGVLDFRHLEQFRHRHIRKSLHIDGIEGLDCRYSWLPPPKSDSGAPSKKLIVICENADEVKILQESLHRWNVIAWICNDASNENFWIDASDQDLVAKEGEEDAPALLFEPSPLIEIAVQACEGDMQEQNNKTSLTIVDLGCGAGRDLAWIVRRDSRFTWLATGVDNLLKTVQRAKLLCHDMRLTEGPHSRAEDIVWAQATMEGTLQALQLGSDSKTKGFPIPPSHKGDDASLHSFANEFLPHSTFDLVLLIRFLPRPLLLNLPAITHAGSIIAISHFTTLKEEQEYLSPDAAKRFEESDVKTLLQSWGIEWHVLRQIIHRAEDGRPIRSCLFQRRRQAGVACDRL
ncbi:hypothetical protein CBS101457_003893 [Exobasidium rhododendri]|nr:hypothetical protein CBS101457_003893 [Exobasidium rhododendri]